MYDSIVTDGGIGRRIGCTYRLSGWKCGEGKWGSTPRGRSESLPCRFKSCSVASKIITGRQVARLAAVSVNKSGDKERFIASTNIRKGIWITNTTW